MRMALFLFLVLSILTMSGTAIWGAGITPTGNVAPPADRTDARDALHVLQVESGIIGPWKPSLYQQNGDVNCDGWVNAIDASLVLQLVADLFPRFTCTNPKELIRPS